MRINIWTEGRKQLIEKSMRSVMFFYIVIPALKKANDASQNVDELQNLPTCAVVIFMCLYSEAILD